MIVGGEQVNQNQRKSRIPSINPETDKSSVETEQRTSKNRQSQSVSAEVEALAGTGSSENSLHFPDKLALEGKCQKIAASNLQMRTATMAGLEEDHFERLDLRSVQLERVGWWILIGVLGSTMVGIWLTVGLVRASFDATQWICLAAILVALGGLVWFSRFIPERSYATTFWQLMPHGLELRRGIWWRHRIFIPANRIQHTDVQQGPIERRFELATLVVNTGGTHEPSISISGLRLEKAEALRDQLSSHVGPSTNGALSDVKVSV